MAQYLKVHFLSQRGDWRTPTELYKELDDEFHFTLDPCPVNPTFDGLAMEWTGSVYVNPPYGRQISRWIKKGYESSLHGALVVMLLPSRTDTAWFHDYCRHGEIRFIRGRLHFDDGLQSAPFPSMIVIFRPCSRTPNE